MKIFAACIEHADPLRRRRRQHVAECRPDAQRRNRTGAGGPLEGNGRWLAKFGVSIYGTRGGPFKPGRWGVSTHKGQTIYLHVQHWAEETLSLPVILAKIVNSSGTDRWCRNRKADR